MGQLVIKDIGNMTNASKKKPWWPHYDIVINNELYLRRYFIIKTPWFGLFLHRIYKPDTNRCPHDHPFSFWSFVLKGWYIERVYSIRGKVTETIRKAGTVAKRKNSHIHEIFVVSHDLWTLMFIKHTNKNWGFWDFSDKTKKKYNGRGKKTVWWKHLGKTYAESKLIEMD